MGHIYREKDEIPIPPGGEINHCNAQVALRWKVAGRSYRKVIGLATSEETMHPNINFRELFPELWRKYYDEDAIRPRTVHAGLYALTLSTVCRTGLYEDLRTAFGPLYANAVVDYAMYSIKARDCTAQLFEDVMFEQLLFSRKSYSDSWLSNLFNEFITPEAICKFRDLWVKRKASGGLSNVWLCIDGTNNDCDVSDSDLAECGKAKSGRGGPVVSYMWAVDSETGRPITWDVYSGAVPDCKAIDGMIRYLSAANFKVEGVILDRGFDSKELLDLIKSKGMKCVLMLKSSASGYQEMLALHSEDIRWRVRQVVDKAGLFGITGRVRVFSSCKEPSCVGLYFNGKGGSAGGITLIQKVLEGAEELEKKIADASRKDEVTVPKGLKKYLKIDKKDGVPVGVRIDYDAWQKSLDARGFFAIASTEELKADELYRLYGKRMMSEAAFSICKSQLGFGTTRVHSDNAIRARLAVAFVAACIRSEFEIACKKLKLVTNVMIQKSDRVTLDLEPNGQYAAIHNLSDNYKKLLGEFLLREADMDAFATELNEQFANPIQSLKRELPAAAAIRKRGPGRPRKIPAVASGLEEQPKRKPGRPKGSKNKSTLAREAAGGLESPIPKRKPGRPKGSKNKKTLEREAAARAQAEAKLVKRGRGRPKGSKNKATLEREAREAALAAASKKRGPGRPKGSKNKAKSSD